MRYDEDEEREDLAPARRARRPRRGWRGGCRRPSSKSPATATARRRCGAASSTSAEQVLADWEGAGKRRLAMSALVTFPRGTDEARATEAARAFFAEAFADNHDYILAGHRDTENFHVHIVVQARGHDGKQIRINRDDIQDLRLLFAEKAAAQGIELDASPRWARGAEQERTAGAAVEGMLRRWRRPELELAGAVLPSPTRREQLEALIEVRRGRDPEADVSPLEYARAAEHVMAHAGALEENAEKVRAMKSAIQLARFGLQQSQAPATCPAAEGAAVEGAVQLARFAWELASKEQGRPEERAHAREIIDKTERALRFSIKEIADPQAQKKAIQARQRLYKAGVQEYRQARQAARDRERGRAREKDTGPEREL